MTMPLVGRLRLALAELRGLFLLLETGERLPGEKIGDKIVLQLPEGLKAESVPVLKIQIMGESGLECA
jgi:hypothetical protein